VSVKDFKTGLLSLELILAFESILTQDNKDIIKNNESTVYNDYDSESKADLILIENTRSL
jgi:hypothetical protein